MSGLRLGGLFEGYGGLTQGAQAIYGGDLAWYSEIDKGALKILNYRHPNVPNLGDITTVDWSTVEPVDILTGGSPCQDLSHAGRRAGMTEGTRSNLWVAMREAIAQLRPAVVVWENVRGAYSAEADSALEFCAGCMGDAWYRGAALRALGRVLGDLSDLGYDARWHGLRAADIGAPHGRFRVFVVATDTTGDTGRFGHGDGAVVAQPSGLRRGTGWPAATGEAGDGRASTDVAGCGLFPTPRATDGTKGGPGQRGSSGDLMPPSAVALLPTPTVQDGSNDGGPSQFDRHSVPLNAVAHLLPTPAVNDMGEGKTVEAWDDWTARMKAAHGNGNGHGANLSIEAQRLLATPTASVADGGPPQDSAGKRDLRLDLVEHCEGRWGQYAAAIARWEQALGRPAPAPTMTSSKGNPQLSPAFVEWLMGLPAGWVDDVPGLTRNEKLKALGNGVVWQQCAAALAEMLTWQAAA